METATKKASPEQMLLNIIKEKGLTAEKTKKSLEELKAFWNEKIGMDYEQVKKNAWR